MRLDPTFDMDSIHLMINGIEQMTPVYAMSDGMLYLPEEMDLHSGDKVDVRYFITTE